MSAMHRAGMFASQIGLFLHHPANAATHTEMPQNVSSIRQFIFKLCSKLSRLSKRLSPATFSSSATHRALQNQMEAQMSVRTLLKVFAVSSVLAIAACSGVPNSQVASVPATYDAPVN